MPRLLRDARLNGIWEGSGNVMSLDVLRALAREPDGLTAFLAECELARRANRRLDAHLDALRPPADEWGTRRGSRTWRSRSRRRCWCGSRRRPLRTPSAPGGWETRGVAFGTLPAGIDGAVIVDRALAV